MSSRPHVLVNMAMTADGKIDTVARAGARISGPADTARVDRLRADADAVMVGARTLLVEDPRLTVRDPHLSAARERDGRPAQPAKVGVVSVLGHGDEGASPREDGAFLTDGGGRVVLCTSSRTHPDAIARMRAQGVDVIVGGAERVDLPACLAALREQGIERLMVEGGSTLVAALLAARLVDELYLAVAPLIFGGEQAPTPVGGPGWTREGAIPLALVDASTNGDGDVIVHYRLPEVALA